MRTLALAASLVLVPTASFAAPTTLRIESAQRYRSSYDYEAMKQQQNHSVIKLRGPRGAREDAARRLLEVALRAGHHVTVKHALIDDESTITVTGYNADLRPEAAKVVECVNTENALPHGSHGPLIPALGYLARLVARSPIC